MSEGTVVTFYSYKGGVGRSFLLANVAALLAQWGYRVLCIDWDLEAPGLALYFKPWLDSKPRDGLLEFIEAFSGGREPDWRHHVSSVNLPKAEENLKLIAAANPTFPEKYTGRIQEISWARLYDEQGLGSYLEHARSQWKDNYDFVFIDSRTGITDSSGICTVHMPDLLVFVFSANNQSLEGVIDVVNRAMKQRNRLPYDRAGLLALPVPSRLDSREERVLTQKWLRIFAERLAPFYASWAHRDLEVLDLLNYTKVPYFTYWSFGEPIPVIEENRNDPESISYNLTTIAALLAQHLGSTEVLINTRDLYIARSKRGNGGSSVHEEDYLFDIFLSYAREDQPFARDLAGALVSLGLRVFFDVNELKPGQVWVKEFKSALRRSRNLTVLIGKRFGDWQEEEIKSALEISLTQGTGRGGLVLLLPVLLPGVSPDSVPTFMRSMNLLRSEGLSKQELAACIKTMVVEN